MRPNRPHIPSSSINVKERGHKTNSTPEPLAYLPSCLQIVVTVVFAAASEPSVSRFRFPSASVRGLLRTCPEGRKQKMTI
jgi:hypothetical protein